MSDYETRVAEIAAQLSPKQRDAVLALSKDYYPATEVGVAGATLRSLWDFKRDFSTTATAVAPPVMLVSRDVWDTVPPRHAWALTALGLDVQSLLNTSKDKAA